MFAFNKCSLLLSMWKRTELTGVGDRREFLFLHCLFPISNWSRQITKCNKVQFHLPSLFFLLQGEKWKIKKEGQEGKEGEMKMRGEGEREKMGGEGREIKWNEIPMSLRLYSILLSDTKDYRKLLSLGSLHSNVSHNLMHLFLNKLFVAIIWSL